MNQQAQIAKDVDGRQYVIKFVRGQKVTTSGYPGSFVRYYSAGMVEVHLRAGLVCVPVEDVIAA